MEKIPNIKLNCNSFSVYDYKGYTVEELLCVFYTKINECVGNVNQIEKIVEEFKNFILNEGLSNEVNKVFNDYIKNGTFEHLINTDLLKSLLDEVRSNNVFTKVNNEIDIIRRKIENNEKFHYIMIGDSTREILGGYIFKGLKEVFENMGIKCSLIAKAGLKMEHFSLINGSLQNGFPTVNNLIEIIEGLGDNTIIDITGGINDVGSSTGEELYSFFEEIENKVKTTKPNVIITYTSPNRYFSELGCERLDKCYKKIKQKHSVIDVLNDVFPVFNTDIENMYFNDNTHPNKKGQLKILDYILKYYISNTYVIDKFNADLYDLRGGIDFDNTVFRELKEAEFKIELNQISGTPFTELYLHKNNGKWYLHDKKSLPSISEALPMNNGFYEISKANWVSSEIDFKCKIYIGNFKILNELETDLYIPLTNKSLVKNIFNSSLKNIQNDYSNKIKDGLKMSEENFTTINKRKLENFKYFKIDVGIDEITSNNAVNYTIDYEGITPDSFVSCSCNYGKLSKPKIFYKVTCTERNKLTFSILNLSDESISSGNYNFSVMAY